MHAVIILMCSDNNIISAPAIEAMAAILKDASIINTHTKELYGGKCQQFFCQISIDLRELQNKISDALSLFQIDVAVLPAENRQKKLLISDMDSTMINQECIDELAEFIDKKYEISAITEQAMRGELDFEQSLTKRVSLLKNLDQSVLDTCFRDKISLMAGAQELLKFMNAHDAHAVLVSGGFTFFAEKIAHNLGFGGYFANELCFDAQNKLDGTVIQPILGRDAKAEILKSQAQILNLDLSDTLAVGDGANDLAMIEIAGLGVAYHAKPKVAKAARVAIHFCDLKALIYLQS